MEMSDTNILWVGHEAPTNTGTLMLVGSDVGRRVGPAHGGCGALLVETGGSREWVLGHRGRATRDGA